jgi:PD-(D/E)XK endonuclease
MSTDDSNRRPRKPRKPAPRKNTKVTGERSEAAFLHKAATLEFGVAKPWGDSRRYDFILDNGACLHRVQVKCTECVRMRAYETRATYTTGKGRAVYTKKDIDFIAAHVVPLDIWYIIPVEICTPAPMLRFYPHRKAKKMRLESYREAWHLLQSPEDTKIEIQASADETLYSDAVTDAHVGTAAPGCPAGQSPAAAGLHGSRVPARLPKSAAPWPIPLLRILATRKGKHIFPCPPS